MPSIGGAQGAGRHRFAAAEDRLVADRRARWAGKGKACCEPSAKAVQSRQAGVQASGSARRARRCRDRKAGPGPRVRRLLPPHRRRRSPRHRRRDRCSPGRARGPSASRLRQPLAIDRVEGEAAAGKIGELCFASAGHSQRQAHRLRFPACAPAESRKRRPFDLGFAQNRQRFDAAFHADAMAAKPGKIIKSLGQSRRCWRAGAARRGAWPAALRIQHGCDFGAGLRILIGDEIEQGTGAEEQAAPPMATALRLQRGLRAAQAKDAGQGPAGKGNDPVGGAGRQDHRLEGNCLAIRRVLRHAGRPRRYPRPGSMGR